MTRKAEPRPKDLIAPSEAARMLGFSSARVLMAARKKELPHYSVLGRTRFRRSEIEQYIEKGRRRAIWE